MEMAHTKALRMISGVSRRDQCENMSRKSGGDFDSVKEASRISCLRLNNVQHIIETRLPKKISIAVVDGIRGRGKPRKRCLDSVDCDLNMRELELE